MSFSHSWASYRTNAQKDLLSAPFLRQCSKTYLGPSEADEYSEALSAEHEWWRAAPTEDTLILAGTDEVLLDGIERFKAKFEAGGNKVRYVKGNDEMHDAAIWSPALGDQEEKATGKALVAWLEERLF